MHTGLTSKQFNNMRTRTANISESQVQELKATIFSLYDSCNIINTLCDMCEDSCDIDFLRSVQKQLADTADQIELICNDF
jgi:hypothetical protein